MQAAASSWYYTAYKSELARITSPRPPTINSVKEFLKPPNIGLQSITDPLPYLCLLNRDKRNKMSIPTTYKAFRRTTGDIPRTIAASTETLPKELGSNDVLIKIHAVSLNFRDVAMLNGRYPVEVEEKGIPASDCAAEVVAVGDAVKNCAVGDHVSVVFDLGNLTGTEDAPMRALGGDVAGVLREYAVYEDKYIVQLPRNLSWEEVSSRNGDKGRSVVAVADSYLAELYHHMCRRDGMECYERTQVG